MVDPLSAAILEPTDYTQLLGIRSGPICPEDCCVLKIIAFICCSFRFAPALPKSPTAIVVDPRERA